MEPLLAAQNARVTKGPLLAFVSSHRLSGLANKSNHTPRGTFHFHSFQGSIFLESPRNSRENGSGFCKERYLERMEKESTPRSMKYTQAFLNPVAGGSSFSKVLSLLCGDCPTKNDPQKEWTRNQPLEHCLSITHMASQPGTQAVSCSNQPMFTPPPRGEHLGSLNKRKGSPTANK